jgi:AraC family transcriptional activator FtrA
MQAHLVAAVTYEGLCTFEFGCTVEFFALPRPELDVPWYEFKVCGVETGPIRAAGGIEITVPYSLKLLDRAQTIVIPGWTGPDVKPPERLLRALRQAHARGVRICSICSGVFVIAAAGLLDDKRATTHWKYASQLVEQYPQIRVQANDLYVDEGSILTSAGSAAGIDMLMHLVRRDYGAKVANQVAQRLVVAPHREGNQAQFVPQPVSANGEGRLAGLLDWLRSHLDRDLTISQLARRAAMSPRTLQREFRRATGGSPHQWLVRQRVARAKELLETSRWSTERIAEKSGMGSNESLRHHFRRQVGMTPMAYRARFTQQVGR